MGFQCTVNYSVYFDAVTRIKHRKKLLKAAIHGVWECKISDQESEGNIQVEITEEEKDVERKITKEIEKLQFYLDESDDLLESEDFYEI